MDADNLLLKEEYFHLNKVVQDFDQKALTIKAWSVTLSMAGMGAAFTQKAAILLLLGGFASVLFWITETLWKSFQQAHYTRIREIESCFASGTSETKPFQIGASWYQAWRQDRWRKLFRISFWPHVCLPHAIVAISGPSMWLLNRHCPFVPVAS